MIDSLAQMYAPDDPDSIRETFIARNPTGRFGLPEEVAEAFLFLASDAASFVNGEALMIDGGRTAVKQERFYAQLCLSDYDDRAQAQCKQRNEKLSIFVPASKSHIRSQISAIDFQNGTVYSDLPFVNSIQNSENCSMTKRIAAPFDWNPRAATIGS